MSFRFAPALTAALAALLTCGAAPGIDTRQAMPSFTATTMDGKKLNNESVKGKVLLVQFWATWCQYCKQDQEAVDDMAEEFAGQGLLVLAVNAGESPKEVKQYLERSPRAVPIVLMRDTNLAALFAAKSYPRYVLVDRKGNIAGEQDGAGGEGALRALLEKAGLK